MKPIRFQAERVDGLYRYWYAPEDDRPVDLGLLLDPADATAARAVGRGREEVAVYLGLVWRITEGLTRYAIGRSFGGVADHTFEFVRWQYSVDAAMEDFRTRDMGFVRAYRREIGLFPLEQFRDLVHRSPNPVASPSEELNVFAVSPGAQRQAELIDRLQGKAWSISGPRLADVVGDEGVFVNFTFVGADLGPYQDSLLVAAQHDLGPQLQDLATEYEQRILDYEQGLSAIMTADDAAAAFARLSGMP